MLTSIRLALIALLVGTGSANAALITTIPNIVVGGIEYTATFHVSSGVNDLFDADRDAIFGDSDGSLFNRAPTFFGDETGARDAASQIIIRLGTTDTTSPNSDSFFIPTAFATVAGVFTGVADMTTDTTNDELTTGTLGGLSTIITFPRVTFERTGPTSIPVPSTLALAGLAMLVMGGMRRRKQNI